MGGVSGCIVEIMEQVGVEIQKLPGYKLRLQLVTGITRSEHLTHHLCAWIIIPRLTAQSNSANAPAKGVADLWRMDPLWPADFEHPSPAPRATEFPPSRLYYTTSIGVGVLEDSTLVSY